MNMRPGEPAIVTEILNAIFAALLLSVVSLATVTASAWMASLFFAP
jgi:hypothetical protein